MLLHKNSHNTEWPEYGLGSHKADQAERDRSTRRTPSSEAVRAIIDDAAQAPEVAEEQLLPEHTGERPVLQAADDHEATAS